MTTKTDAIIFRHQRSEDDFLEDRRTLSRKDSSSRRKAGSSNHGSMNCIPEMRATVFSPYGCDWDEEKGIQAIGFTPSGSERTQATVPVGRSFDYSDKEPLSDPSITSIKPGADINNSMILSLERTLFAALNNAFLLAAGGVGLMSVGNGDQDAVNIGKAILSLSIFMSLFALVIHNVRLQQMRASGTFGYSQSLVWGSLVSLLTLIILGLELYFGVLYPYLLRAAAVSIVPPSDPSENIFETNGV